MKGCFVRLTVQTPIFRDIKRDRLKILTVVKLELTNVWYFWLINDLKQLYFIFLHDYVYACSDELSPDSFLSG